MSHRIKQVNEQILAELAEMVREHVEFSDGLITLTAVETAPNLRQAKVYISVLPEKHTGTALNELRKHNSHFNKLLSQRLSIKFIPKLIWHMDEKIKHMNEIDDVLRRIKEEEQGHAND